MHEMGEIRADGIEDTEGTEVETGSWLIANGYWHIKNTRITRKTMDSKKTKKINFPLSIQKSTVYRLMSTVYLGLWLRKYHHVLDKYCK